jgi:hypothetical protein
MTNVDTTIFSWKGQIFFLATLILTKNCLQLISSKCSNILLTTYLFCLMDVFCNIQSACQWEQTVLLF